MNKELILEKIKNILVEEVKLIVEGDVVNEKTHLQNDYAINSMQMVVLLVEIEKEFKIEMDDENVTQETIVDINQLLTYLERKI